MIITNDSGWTLLRDEKEFFLVTPEGHRSKVYALNVDQAIAKFHEAIERGWVWVDYEYFVPSVYMSEVQVEKNRAQHKSNQKIPAGRFLTKEDAINAINKVMPKAQHKFSECSHALNELKNKMDFESGDTYEGDTHGTYNDHSFIRFQMDGFYFSFEA